MYEASHYHERGSLPGRLGAWNSDILGYLSNRAILSLDGLVNDDVYEYIRLKDTVGTLDEMRVEYVVAFPVMFEDDFLAMRGGYSDGRLWSRLKTIKVLRSLDRRDFGVDLTLGCCCPPVAAPRCLASTGRSRTDSRAVGSSRKRRAARGEILCQGQHISTERASQVLPGRMERDSHDGLPTSLQIH